MNSESFVRTIVVVLVLLTWFGIATAEGEQRVFFCTADLESFRSQEFDRAEQRSSTVECGPTESG